MMPLDAVIGFILYCFGVFLFIIFLYRHRWDESARGFCCVYARRWSVLYDPDVPSLFYTQPVIVCANKTSLPSDHFHWTKDTLWKYVLWYSGMVKGNHQQYLFPFSIHSSHQMMMQENMLQCCQWLQCDPTIFFSCCCVFVLLIKINNCLLSLSCPGSQAWTSRSRVIGRTGWGICWRRHSP